ncbi:MAG: B-box zinc finger protein [Terracidiphilus sp.]
MDCVNHSGVTATAFCQSCGKALCANCVRHGAGGQILCEPCMTAWQTYQQPFVAPVAPGAPNPVAAAVLGLIPGVGAMYNGQFFKGLIHVVIFAVLISITDHYPIFGLFIAAWVLYQSFEAYHTARARRDGEPLPDPLGLNELGSWLNLGGRQSSWGQPGPTPGQGPAAGQGPVNAGPMNAGPINPGPINAGPAGTNPAPSGWQSPYTGQAPYQYGATYAPPAAGFVDPGVPPIPPVPPVPPVPPMHWRRKEPIGAIVLIALGLLFLLGQLDLFRGRVFEFSWPLMLIGLGVWLVIRRAGYGQGGPR